MSLTLSQSHNAVGINVSSSFAAQGGTAPYVYSVRSGGAGGTINSSTGIYTAPAVYPTTSATQNDIIQVRDNVGLIATATILVGDPVLLVCDIIQSELGLAQGRVYLWGQKITEPSDGSLFVVVSVLSCKAFGNTNGHTSGAGLTSNASVNLASTLQIDILSRDRSAMLRKEEILLALASDYSQAQQETNSFFIGKIPPGAQFNNLSQQDGAAIPYRFVISINIQYFAMKNKAVNYMNQYSPVTINYAQK